MHPRERLAQFEDEKLGTDAPRQFGKPERGHGSRFQKLSDADKREYALLEELVAAQDAVDEAESKLTAARIRLTEAERKAGIAPEATEVLPPEPDPAPPAPRARRPRPPKKLPEPAVLPPAPVEPPLPPEPREDAGAPDLRQEPAPEPRGD